VVEDPEPGGPRNAWRSHRACLEATPAGATHLLVLQDDALPGEGFHDAIMEAISERPESVLLPFVQGFNYLRKQMREARTAGETFMRFHPRSFCPVVAIVYPATVASDLLAWAERTGHRRGADDGIVAFYCKARRIVPAAMVPCICDHDEDIQSVGSGIRRGQHRRAALL
jgi:GR25 family glycosyltransferase involved in LPS biosynthesis